MATEDLYEIAATELETNAPRKGVYARAFSDAMGDKAKADALYIRLRVEQLSAALSAPTPDTAAGVKPAPGVVPSSKREIEPPAFTSGVKILSVVVAILLLATLTAIGWGLAAFFVIRAAEHTLPSLLMYALMWLVVRTEARDRYLPFGWHLFGFLATIIIPATVRMLYEVYVYRDANATPTSTLFFFLALPAITAFLVSLVLKRQTKRVNRTRR